MEAPGNHGYHNTQFPRFPGDFLFLYMYGPGNTVIPLDKSGKIFYIYL